MSEHTRQVPEILPPNEAIALEDDIKVAALQYLLGNNYDVVNKSLQSRQVATEGFVADACEGKETSQERRQAIVDSYAERAEAICEAYARDCPDDEEGQQKLLRSHAERFIKVSNMDKDATEVMARIVDEKCETAKRITEDRNNSLYDTHSQIESMLTSYTQREGVTVRHILDKFNRTWTQLTRQVENGDIQITNILERYEREIKQLATLKEEKMHNYTQQHLLQLQSYAEQLRRQHNARQSARNRSSYQEDERRSRRQSSHGGGSYGNEGREHRRSRDEDPRLHSLFGRSHSGNVEAGRLLLRRVDQLRLSGEEDKKIYRHLAREFHSDVNGTDELREEVMKLANSCYDRKQGRFTF